MSITLPERSSNFTILLHWLLESPVTKPMKTKNIEHRVFIHATPQEIYDALMNGAAIDETWLAEVQKRDNLFPEADYGVYAS